MEAKTKIACVFFFFVVLHWSHLKHEIFQEFKTTPEHYSVQAPTQFSVNSEYLESNSLPGESETPRGVGVGVGRDITRFQMTKSR